MKSRIKYLVGVDEVGRGPLAGPVAVCVFCIPQKPRHPVSRLGADFFASGVVRDSKKMTAKMREKIFKSISRKKASGHISCAVAFVSASFIDRAGISCAIRTALRSALRVLHIFARECRVLLDGGLKAPAEFTRQKTIIKGDEKEAVIALASIVAKVSRDRKMCAFAKKYPQYGFEKHKGYGTREHYAALQKHGPCPIHRKTFLHL